MRYRKKPVVIEAVQIRCAEYSDPDDVSTWDTPFSAGPDWLRRAFSDGTLRPRDPMGSDYLLWEIETLEGVMAADPGDWIIRGVKGELYPCKPDIFAMTYEPADDPAR